MTWRGFRRTHRGIPAPFIEHWPWAYYLTSLCFVFPICTMGSIAKVVMKHVWLNACKCWEDLVSTWYISAVLSPPFPIPVRVKKTACLCDPQNPALSSTYFLTSADSLHPLCLPPFQSPEVLFPSKAQVLPIRAPLTGRFFPLLST